MIDEEKPVENLFRLGADLPVMEMAPAAAKSRSSHRGPDHQESKHAVLVHRSTSVACDPRAETTRGAVRRSSQPGVSVVLCTHSLMSYLVIQGLKSKPRPQGNRQALGQHAIEGSATTPSACTTTDPGRRRRILRQRQARLASCHSTEALRFGLVAMDMDSPSSPSSASTKSPTSGA